MKGKPERVAAFEGGRAMYRLGADLTKNPYAGMGTPILSACWTIGWKTERQGDPGAVRPRPYRPIKRRAGAPPRDPDGHPRADLPFRMSTEDWTPPPQDPEERRFGGPGSIVIGGNSASGSSLEFVIDRARRPPS